MSFLAILFALLLEQARPLAQTNPVYSGNRAWVLWVVRSLDAGAVQHAWAVWCIAVLLPTVLSGGVHLLLLHTLGWVAALVWNVVILYVTLGFRQFSHHFTHIRDALYVGDEALARQKLAQWMRIDASDLPRREIIRLVIEHSLLSAHRHVFGVLTWYCVFAALGLGPAGAVFYRMAEYIARRLQYAAQKETAAVSPALLDSVAKAWYLTDWVSARITALAFAFVGSFEDAVESWRRQALRFPADNDTVVLAASAGALNVRLGTPEHEGQGDAPQIIHLRAAVGLVWRTVVMWLVILALLTLAHLV